MVERELSREAPFGGLCADAMGLGKTVELLAVMCGHLPTGTERKATLIVLPTSLISQWMFEIRKHVDEHLMPRVLVYKSTWLIPEITLADQDIVLTSYHELMASYPRLSKAQEVTMTKDQREAWISTAPKGAIHTVKWYRLVLDEAHLIKNYKSHTSLAASAVNARYRWALTGTPIQNKLEE